MSKPILSEDVKNKWKGVIEAEGVAPITDLSVKNITIRMLESLSEAQSIDEAGTPQSPASAGTDAVPGNAENYNPVLISLVRRTAPSLVAHQLMGVQPMSGPTGLIFAMKAWQSANGGGSWSEVYGPRNGAPDPTLSGKYSTPDGEKLGRDEEVAGSADADPTAHPVNDPVYQTDPWNEMTFTIDKTSVEAQTRALKGQYTTELAQDLRAIHGLDAETELANLISGEIAAEINRETIATIIDQAIPTLNTASFDHATATGFDFYDYSGVIDVEGTLNLTVGTGDTYGRWEQEQYKNLIGFINRVAHEVALGTRRGLANRIITNPIIAAALDMASKLDPARDTVGGSNMNNDNVGITYGGRLLGKYDVYVDPYMTANTVVVGYKGSNAYDAGYYYCPYVALSMMKAIGEEDFQPRIGFKTRYGMKNNPYVSGNSGENWYFRKFTVAGI